MLQQNEQEAYYAGPGHDRNPRFSSRSAISMNSVYLRDSVPMRSQSSVTVGGNAAGNGHWSQTLDLERSLKRDFKAALEKKNIYI